MIVNLNYLNCGCSQKLDDKALRRAGSVQKGRIALHSLQFSVQLTKETMHVNNVTILRRTVNALVVTYQEVHSGNGNYIYVHVILHLH